MMIDRMMIDRMRMIDYDDDDDAVRPWLETSSWTQTDNFKQWQTVQSGANNLPKLVRNPIHVIRPFIVFSINTKLCFCCKVTDDFFHT